MPPACHSTLSFNTSTISVILQLDLLERSWSRTLHSGPLTRPTHRRRANADLNVYFLYPARYEFLDAVDFVVVRIDHLPERVHMLITFGIETRLLTLAIDTFFHMSKFCKCPTAVHGFSPNLNAASIDTCVLSSRQDFASVKISYTPPKPNRLLQSSSTDAVPLERSHRHIPIPVTGIGVATSAH